MSNNAYIVSAVRTAGGKKNGRLSAWHPADLGAKVLDELVYRSGIKPDLIDDVIFGCSPREFPVKYNQYFPLSSFGI